MIESKIEELKKEYKAIAIPDYLVSNGWLDLSLKLALKNKSIWHVFLVRGLIFASIVLFLSVGVVGVSQAAKPGDLLFPVKVFSEKVAVIAGVNPEISVVRRANDLIDLSKKDSSAMEKASQEYRKTLESGKQDAEKNGQTKEFKQTLDEQEKKLNDAQRNDHSAPEILRAIEETAKVKGEVKGVKSPEIRQNNDQGGDSNQNTKKSNSGSGDSHNENRGGD